MRTRYQRPFRTATLEECWQYGAAGARRRGMLPPIAGGTGISLVGHTKAVGNGTTTVTTTGVDTTGTTAFVAAITSIGGGTPSISDSQGGNSNTWTTLSNSGSNPYVVMFVCTHPTHVGTGHTFTATGNSACPIVVEYFSGTLDSTTVDINTGANQGSGTSLAPGSATPAHDGEVVVTCMAEPTVSSTINGGFTITDEAIFNNGVSYGLSLAYLIQTTAAASNPTWTNSGGFAIGVQQVSLQQAAGGGGGGGGLTAPEFEPHGMPTGV